MLNIVAINTIVAHLVYTDHLSQELKLILFYFLASLQIYWYAET